jgi:hypothetical protein
MSMVSGDNRLEKIEEEKEELDESLLNAKLRETGVSGMSDNDFDVNEKGGAKNMVINEDVMIVEYAPAIFDQVKQFDGITPEQVRKSLSTDANRDSIFKAKESAGKSGSFFFFSYDRKFLIKTMNGPETKLFRESLPFYLLHLRDNPDSLIARIYGIFTV